MKKILAAMASAPVIAALGACGGTASQEPVELTVFAAASMT